ncbi:MAG: urease accessory UreF family protein [Casimicrobiaceae bacterium]
MKSGSLLHALHLASTTLPVGAFSYSQGLEWAVECGTIGGREDAACWIRDALRWSIGRFEAPLAIAAQRAWQEHDAPAIADLNARMLATRETAELRAETVQMGYSLRRWCIETEALDEQWARRLRALDTPAYPVVFAAIAAAWQMNEHAALSAYLWGWLENQVNAALKSVPLGQTDAQRILLSLAPLLDDVAAGAIELAAMSPSTHWTTQCPALAIASSRHETQYSRLFRS